MSYTEVVFDLGPVTGSPHRGSYTRAMNLPPSAGPVSIEAVLEGDSEGSPKLMAYEGNAVLGMIRGLNEPLTVTVASSRTLVFHVDTFGASARLELKLKATPTAGPSAPGSGTLNLNDGQTLAVNDGQSITITVPEGTTTSVNITG